MFATYRIDEQIDKGLDRKVWLPSGGSLVIDRTEAMTVVDVNTGKFTGSGGNLEETVTKNNLEAAEEIVRQLRLRDIGGIIVVDFIDMVLESNRDLVLRRLVECLGRDRTRHQVAEVTSLGLVQMTRKRIGTGLLEAFSEDCEHCQGRGVIIQDAPGRAEERQDDGDGRRSAGAAAAAVAARRLRQPADTAAATRAAAPSEPARPRHAHVRPVAQGRRRDGAPRPPRSRRPPTAEAVPTRRAEPSDDARRARRPSCRRRSPRHRAPRRRRSEAPPGEAVRAAASPPTEPAAARPTEPAERGAAGRAGKPKVVTRTRRRSRQPPGGSAVAARRRSPQTGVVKPGAARPSSPSAGDDRPVEAVAPATGGGDAGPTSRRRHVPVKKKGSRKR